MTVKPDIHPEYREVEVTCSCGNHFTVHSTYPEKTLTVEVCSACHPFYTGKHKILESAGQVDKFRKRYGKKGGAAAQAKSKAEDKAESKVTDNVESKAAGEAPGKTDSKAARTV